MRNARVAQRLEQRVTERGRQHTARRVVNPVTCATRAHRPPRGPREQHEAEQADVDRIGLDLARGEARLRLRIDVRGICGICGGRGRVGIRNARLRGRFGREAHAGSEKSEQREHRHQDRERIEDRQRFPVPLAEAQPEMQADDEMRPQDHDERRMPDQRDGVVPDAAHDRVIARLGAEDRLRDARPEHVRDQKQRNREPERELCELPPRHAQRPPAPQRVQAEGRVGQQGGVESQRAERRLPDRPQHVEKRLLRLDREHPERVVDEMGGDEDGEDEPGDVAQPPHGARRAGARTYCGQGGGAHGADCRLSCGPRATGPRGAPWNDSTMPGY